MAKKRGLAGFGNVAVEKSTEEIEVQKEKTASFPLTSETKSTSEIDKEDVDKMKKEVAATIQEDIYVPTENANITVDSIVSQVTQKPRKINKKQVSIYLDEDIAEQFDKFGKKYGKGAKSDLINTFLRSALPKYL